MAETEIKLYPSQVESGGSAGITNDNGPRESGLQGFLPRRRGLMADVHSDHL